MSLQPKIPLEALMLRRQSSLPFAFHAIGLVLFLFSLTGCGSDVQPRKTTSQSSVTTNLPVATPYQPTTYYPEPTPPQPTPDPTPIPTPDPRSLIVPGGITFSSAGSYVFIVPHYNTLTVKVWGGGGGGGGSGSAYPMGGNGGDSVFIDLVAGGGGGGRGGYSGNGPGGNAGLAHGGEIRINGKPGLPGFDFKGGEGAAEAHGSLGAAGGDSGFNSGENGANATAIGGGGGGGGGSYIWRDGGGGGGGGGAFVMRTYTWPTLPLGTVVNTTVGGGGGAGSDDTSGGRGANGRVEVTWD
jgi:hypothetical protein